MSKKFSVTQGVSRTKVNQSITVTDIAKACGVSRSTVSLVLRESPLVNEKTRERVKEYIQQSDYVYNRAAANLRRQTSSSIALIINDLSNPFFAEFAAGVDELLAEQGFVLLLGSTAESPKRQQAVLSSLMEHTPAGLILSPAYGSQLDDLTKIINKNHHVLLFNRELEKMPWDFMALDNKYGTILATEHLIQLGHKKIAFYGGDPDSSSSQERRAGYFETLQKYHLEINPNWQVYTQSNRLDAITHANQLFSVEPYPTAAVCYNDTVALGLISALTQRGIQVGKEFSITGFDDIPEAGFSVPALTTLTVNPRERGYQAAELLLQRINNKNIENAQRIVAPVSLMIRESSCNI